MSRFFKSAAFPILIVVVLAFFAQKLISPGDREKVPTYSEFLTQVEQGRVETVTINTKDNTIDVEPKGDEKKYETAYPDNTEQSLVALLRDENKPGGAIDVQVKGKGGGGWLTVLTYVLPFVIFLFFWLFIINQMQGGGSKVMSFGKSRAKRMSVDSPKITFRDVAGVDEAVEELHEIKEFLENPKKFQALGARIPKGVLLYGPPGTGKTLLARAVAGEAGVPFFSISGSDFVEMFVGVGASRVRDLFEQAKQNSPCIIFMDEIDAVGRHRGAGLGGGHDEREQTLNQLLVEMDGFEMKDNIILIAATNRPDILDPALLRPGRFDRQIVVDRPDRKGRAKILEVHTRGKPLAKEIDLDNLAAQTPGFTGADLSNLVNEAALLAARTGNREIDHRHLEEGIMRVIAGPGEEDPRDEREGAPRHGLPRDGPRDRRPLPREHRPGPQDLGDLARPGARLHDLAADRGQVPHHARGAERHDGDDPRRPRRGGDRLRRGHDRRLERPREGHRQREADGHALRHVREARPARVRARPRPAVPRAASSRRSPTTRTTSRARSTPRSAGSSRRRTRSARDILAERRKELDVTSEILLRRETIDREQFLQLLDGKSEEEVFGADEPVRPQIPPPPPQPAPERPERAPRPLPRPGFAGGTAEMRSDERDREP